MPFLNIRVLRDLGGEQGVFIRGYQIAFSRSGARGGFFAEHFQNAGDHAMIRFGGGDDQLGIERFDRAASALAIP